MISGLGGIWMKRLIAVLAVSCSLAGWMLWAENAGKATGNAAGPTLATKAGENGAATVIVGSIATNTLTVEVR